MGGGEKEEKIVFTIFPNMENDRFERARGLVDSFFFLF